jgi:4-hydroxy-2-oxoheptanedioate aldolase
MTAAATPFNDLKRKWDARSITTGTCVAIPAGIVGEIIAHQGWDSVIVDVQHGLIDYQVAAEIIQAMGSTDVPVLVRVASNDAGGIMKVLDAGALGVLCPAVESAAAARRFVGACRYPLEGFRSFGPYRASLRFSPNYVAEANSNVVAAAMIETKAGVDALEEILDVPGIDMAFVGPTDLSLSMGLPGVFDPTFPAVETAIKYIADVANSRGVVPGIYVGTPEFAKRMLEFGYRHLVFSGDLRMLAAASAAARIQLHSLISTAAACTHAEKRLS